MASWYITSSMAHGHAKDWYEGNYAGITYPKAGISSQRISTFFTVYRKCRKEHAHSGLDTESGIPLDCTGFSNSIHVPLTAVSNHNGEISNEVRLICAVHQEIEMPFCFRYAPGNVRKRSTSFCGD